MKTKREYSKEYYEEMEAFGFGSEKDFDKYLFYEWYLSVAVVVVIVFVAVLLDMVL